MGITYRDDMIQMGVYKEQQLYMDRIFNTAEVAIVALQQCLFWKSDELCKWTCFHFYIVQTDRQIYAPTFHMIEDKTMKISIKSCSS